MSGYLKLLDPHLHISVSDDDFHVIGGLFLSGTIVLKSLDILLSVIPNLQYKTIGNINDKPDIVDVYVLQDCPWLKRAIKLLLS